MTLGYYVEKLDYERNRIRIKKEERGLLKNIRRLQDKSPPLWLRHVAFMTHKYSKYHTSQYSHTQTNWHTG